MNIESTQHESILLENSRAVDWSVAALAYAQQLYGTAGLEFASKYWVNELNEDYQFILPTISGARILVIGGPAGNGMITLSERVKTITILESRKEIAQNIQLMAAQANLTNLSVVDSCTESSSLVNGAMDLIIQEFPLFDCAYPELDRPIIALDSEWMTFIYNQLRPSGYFYLSFENLNSPTHLSRRIKRGDLKHCSSGSTYWQISKLLKKHGFELLQVFYPIPEHRRFSFVVERKNRATFRLLAKLLKPYPRYSRLRALGISMMGYLQIPLENMIWPGYCILARKI